jgi:hypothetical protein
MKTDGYDTCCREMRVQEPAWVLSGNPAEEAVGRIDARQTPP